MSTDAAITTLNQLIAVAVDGVEGLRLAAGKAEDPQVGALFARLAAEREAVVAALQDEVRRWGGEAEHDGTLSGAAHRALASLRAAVADADRAAALLAETERGEGYAVERFEDALRNEDLPPEVRAVIGAQLPQLRRARERVAAMAAFKA